MRRASTASKILHMPAAEIAGRFRAAAGDLVERVLQPSGLAANPERLRRALQPGVRVRADWKRALLAHRRQHRPRFLAGVEQRDSMRRLLEGPYAKAWESTCVEAARVRTRSIVLFGQRFDLGRSIDWQRDPVSGRPWADGWHSAIPLSGRERAGDVKYVWELNRHQFLIDLAKRWWVREDPADAADVLALVRHWIQRNPYGRGVSWTSPLEPAYRSVSWLWVYDLCLDSPALDEETHTLWLAAFHDHATFLSRHLELYSSPFNHLIGEAAVLYVLGVRFPEFRDAPAWRRRGRRVLEERLHAQFYGDGGSVEQAVCYHHATLGFYLLAALVGRASGDDLSSAVWAAIERAIEFSLYLVQPDGQMPAVGDMDDANPIRPRHPAVWDFRMFQAVGAVLCGRPDFKYVARGFPLEALWLLGPSGRDQFLKLEQRRPEATSTALQDSGYFVLRSDWSENADYVCMDCGEQAGGLRRDSIPSAAHGHADCLSATLFLRGRPLLVDAGFYTYNGEEAWERHFRETAAHNTARVDGRDQARHVARMMWSNAPAVRLEHWTSDGAQAWVTGSHDGYARGACGLVHRRTIWLRFGGYVLIYDEFLGEGEHHVEINFQLPAQSSAALRGQTLVAGDFGFYWFGSRPIEAEVRTGGRTPDGGWVAPSLGVRVPAPRLTLVSRTKGAHEGFLTVIAHRTGARVSPVPRHADAVEPGLPIGVTVATPCYVDHVVAGNGTPTAIGGFETDGLLAVWRLKDAEVVETTRIGGTYAGPSHPPAPGDEPKGGTSRCAA